MEHLKITGHKDPRHSYSATRETLHIAAMSRICMEIEWEEGSKGDCSAISAKGLYCTRKAGHEGPHHAHSMNQRCIEVWGDK